MEKQECSSLHEARARVSASGQRTPSQALGRRFPIGCVALEITQRCILDCTLCYLSGNAEAVKDTPLGELHRRIEGIFTYYGLHTDVQVTGGEPTLRKPSDLVEIVGHIAARRMRSALFTNEICAKRDLLVELSAADLVDVAFHVDLTQERRGYDTEVALNEIHKIYIDRARGLPLNVIFNTSVFAGNFDEIAGLAAYFVRHSDAVSFASFQLHADTGRGRERGRPARITPDSVAERIQEGAARANLRCHSCGPSYLQRLHDCRHCRRSGPRSARRQSLGPVHSASRKVASMSVVPASVIRKRSRLHGRR